MKLKPLLSIVTAIGMLCAGLSLPAQAAVSPTISIVNTNDTLSGSAISGYGADTVLRLAIISSAGSLRWNDNSSGAARVSNAGDESPGIWLEGTQAQLNASMAGLEIIKPCGGRYKIYAQVTDSGFLKNPKTGHLYKLSPTNGNFDTALAAAAATPLVSGTTNNYGYLATITSQIENILLPKFYGDTLISASDRVIEGDWKWMSGPDAGTSFYSGNVNTGGALVPGMFGAWSQNEPNDYNTGEDYAQTGDGSWNDINEDYVIPFAIEWGGRPGENLTSVIVAEDSLEVVVAGDLLGSGTIEEPFLIPNAAALLASGVCGEENVYLKQTENFTLPADWAGDQSLRGSYDGNGKTITYAPGTVATHNRFGIWAFGNQGSSVANLSVVGDIASENLGTVGLLFGEANTKLTDVNVSGSISITTAAGTNSGNIGGVVGDSSGSTVTRVKSNVDITGLVVAGSSISMIGGIFGHSWGSITSSSWIGAISLAGEGSVSYVGGIAGASDCGTLGKTTAEGSITVQNPGNDIGGFMGYYCQEGGRPGSFKSQADVDVFAPLAHTVGGFAGYGDGNFSEVEALGDVTGRDRVGGLIGFVQDATFNNVVASGNVTATERGGSLIGVMVDFDISRSYSRGTVTAGISRGMFGSVDGGIIEKSHWVPSQSTIAEPSPLLVGEVPYSLSDATSLNYYQADGWSISADFNEGPTWTICSGFNAGYPFLTNLYEEDQCYPAQTRKPIPTIVGSSIAGSKLTGRAGTWDSGTTLAYQWKANGEAITGATALTYRTVAGDVGKTITFTVRSIKATFRVTTKTSAGLKITAGVIAGGIELSIGGFQLNSWWAPIGFLSKIKTATRLNRSAKKVTCTGIVGKAWPAWQKKLGLERAELACATVKMFSPKVKTTLKFKVSKPTDQVVRGVKITFSD